MNQVTPITCKAPITSGQVKMQLYIDIYNTRVSYPTLIILLAMADVKACFCFPRIHADLTGAFGFLAGGYFNLATAMVFGSTTSASSWEPIRRAIQALSVVYAHPRDLIKKHRNLLDMISWATLDPAPDLARAIPCSIKTGVLDDQGNKLPLPARIYGDDALTLATSKENMEQVLAALIEAIFAIMSTPDTSVCQCSIAMDKWEKLHVAPIQKMLGLVINTNRMTVSVPDDYIQSVRLLIDSTWHTHCQQYPVKEAQELTGRLGHLEEGANWVFHLLTHLYASIAYALSENKRFLADSSPEFQTLIKSLWSGYFFCNVKDQIRHISFAIKRSAKLVYQSRCQYNITKSMRQEIEFFHEKLLPKSRIRWESPIAHIIPRTPTFITFGDSCLEEVGGYSLSFGFWWHLQFPEVVELRTLLHKSGNVDGLLISINVLKFVTVIINYCAALHMVLSTNPTNDPYPVLLNIIDNASTLSWTMGACRKSRIGRFLACFFCSLLINSPLRINSQWISTHHNAIADDISCAKSAALEHTHSHPSFDYSSLQQKYPELSHCSFFQPAPKLISLIWKIVLTERWPCHDKRRRLTLRPLGNLTTSSGVQS
jgi:hypothetical protein